MVGLVTNPAAKLDTIENVYAAVAATAFTESRDQ